MRAEREPEPTGPRAVRAALAPAAAAVVAGLMVLKRSV